MIKNIKLIVGIVLLVAFSFIQNAEAQVAKNINASQFSEIIKDKEVQLVDVRTAREVVAGKIEGAVNIDYYGQNFKEEIAKLDKGKTIAVYCRSGGRSGSAMSILKDLGFKNIYNLSGGMIGWQSNKMHVVK